MVWVVHLDVDVGRALLAGYPAFVVPPLLRPPEAGGLLWLLSESSIHLVWFVGNGFPARELEAQHVAESRREPQV